MLPQSSTAMPPRTAHRPANCDASVKAKASGITASPPSRGENRSSFCVKKVMTR